MNKIFIVLLLILCLFVVSGCQKDESTVMGIANVEVAYGVDDELLLFDTIRYSNEAGNSYSVTRLEYYLSDITFLSADKAIFKTPEIQYVNARSASTNSFSLSDIPARDYDCIELTIGLSPANNVSNSLPNTIENNNMFWPDVMGGGYHFVKMEGHYLDNTSHTSGYAMHLGVNGNEIKVKISGLNIPVREGTAVTIKLRMNINEWYRNPAIYDFNIDGNYTMGIASLMEKLRDNGKDVFTATIE